MTQQRAPANEDFVDDFVAALCAIGDQQVIDLAERLGQLHNAALTTPAVSGAAPFAFRETAAGYSYYLGEAPLSQAAVQLTSPHGQVGEGAAVVLGRNRDFAIALAILDCVWAHKFSGFDEVSALIDSGRAAIAARDAQRAMIRARTRVDFSTMDVSRRGGGG